MADSAAASLTNFPCSAHPAPSTAPQSAPQSAQCGQRARCARCVPCPDVEHFPAAVQAVSTRSTPHHASRSARSLAASVHPGVSQASQHPRSAAPFPAPSAELKHLPVPASSALPRSPSLDESQSKILSHPRGNTSQFPKTAPGATGCTPACPPQLAPSSGCTPRAPNGFPSAPSPTAPLPTGPATRPQPGSSPPSVTLAQLRSCPLYRQNKGAVQPPSASQSAHTEPHECSSPQCPISEHAGAALRRLLGLCSAGFHASALAPPPAQDASDAATRK